MRNSRRSRAITQRMARPCMGGWRSHGKLVLWLRTSLLANTCGWPGPAGRVAPATRCLFIRSQLSMTPPTSNDTPHEGRRCGDSVSFTGLARDRHLVPAAPARQRWTGHPGRLPCGCNQPTSCSFSPCARCLCGDHTSPELTQHALICRRAKATGG